MGQDRKPTPMARRIVRLLAHTISTEEGAYVAPLVQRLQLTDLPTGVPAGYTLHLSPEVQGTFLVTCRELPDLEIYARDEDEALAMAEQGIREAFAAKQNPSSTSH
jgi:hypothetical protein